MDFPNRIKAIFSPTSPEEAPTSHGAKRIILVVEDDDALRWMLVRALEASYKVVEATDGKAALDLIGKMRTPDAIICDVMMPRIDGLSLVRALKADPKLSVVPVLLLTARASTVAHLEGINAGARHYVTKPFKMTDLLEKVEKMIRQPAGQARHSAVIP